MAGPISIRRSLLWNVLLVIILLSGGIMGTTFVVFRHATAELASSLTSKTLEQTDGQLRGFFTPVVYGLEVARAWSESGLLEVEDPEEMRRLFTPLMRRVSHVSSLMVADSQGREFMLMREGKTWKIRQTRQDEWGERTHWWEWEDGEAQPAESWRVLDYDPRDRPWYEGAVARGAQRGGRWPADAFGPGVYWTEPYTFYTTREPGITASITYEAGDELEHVIGFDVLLRDISAFTTGLQVSPNGKVVVMMDDGRVIGLPRDERFTDPVQQREALLKQPEQLGITLASDAVRALEEQYETEEETGPVRFHSGGESWWGEARLFELASDRMLLIAVVVPESDLLGGVMEMRMLIALITLTVIALAIWRAVVMARRYSEPIEALVRESDRISQLDLDPGRPIESPVREVRRLTAAHERMRIALQSLLRLERDLQLARQIQQRTFPNELPTLGGFDIGACSEPAEETGGDSYDVVGYQSAPAGEPIVLSAAKANRAVLLLADATGHGVGPALSVAQVRAMLRMAVRMNEPLEVIAVHLNDQLCADLPEGRFITAWLGELNATEHTLRGFSAGQGPIIRYDAGEDTFRLLETDTLPLGILHDLEVHIGEAEPMEPGDIVAVISDGFIEAAGEAGELYGTPRVIEVIRANRRKPAGEILAALRAAVTEFTGGAPADDDRTAIFIKRTGR